MAQAAGTAKTYTVEASFAAEDVIDWNPAGTASTSRSLTGSGSNSAVAATALVESGGLERIPTGSIRRDDGSVAATLLRAAGDAGSVVVTFGPGPVMGAGVRFEGSTGRITARDASGNVLATAVAGATSFAGIRSSLSEIADVVIEAPAGAAATVSFALRPAAANEVFFVNQLFQDLYGRGPSARELDERVEDLRAGTATPAQMAAGMLTAGEFHDRAGYLAKSFLALLRRDADFASWSQIYALMRGGASKEAVLGGFVSTPDFAALYPSALSDAEFVAKVHQEMLGRQPEANELEMWMAQIAGGSSRAAVVGSFLEGPEVEGRMAARINISLSYLALLRRTPGSEEMERWTAAFSGGAPLTEAVNAILASPEYAARF
jgi:hypothetical protein